MNQELCTLCGSGGPLALGLCSDCSATSCSGSELPYSVRRLLSESMKYDTCMSLFIDTDSKTVELILDTGISYYMEWIKGEGGDIGVLRCQETDRVVGCHLPLLNERLAVSHKGPFKLNEGFLIEETKTN